MRRGLASLIMALSLVVATASWGGFILSRTVLDPGRSERLADHLLDNEQVRAVIVDRLADAVEAKIPAAVPVTRSTIELAASQALEDPRVEAVVRDGIVKTHQNALNGVDEPVSLDASALGQVGREKVLDVRPDLASVLPQAPTLEVELPASGLSWIGSIKNAVDRFTKVSAAIALIGMTAAFIMARNRPAALRRMAFWAFGSAAFWIIAAYAIPALLSRIAPSSASIATAVIDVFFGAMIVPALILAGAGIGLLLTSFAWPALIRRRPAATLDRRPSAPRAGDSNWAPTMPSRPAAQPASIPVPAQTSQTVGAIAPGHHPPDPTAQMWVANVQQWPQEVNPDAVTEIWSQPGSGTTPIAPAPDQDRQVPPTPEWVEGVGYVAESGPGSAPDSRI